MEYISKEIEKTVLEINNIISIMETKENVIYIESIRFLLSKIDLLSTCQQIHRKIIKGE